MRCLVVGMGFSLALVLTGCTINSLPPAQPRSPETAQSRASRGEAPSTIILQADAAKAYAAWRWIGIRETGGGECPSIGSGWNAQPLFGRQPSEATYRSATYGPALETERQPAANPANPAKNPEAAPALERFCLYEFRGDGRPPAPAPGRGLLRLDPDPAAMVLSGADDDLQEMTWSPLRSHFRREVGWVSDLPRAATPPVRLSFIDTQKTGVGTPQELPSDGAVALSKHGYTLAHIGRELVCGEAKEGSGRCAAEITTRLALPIIRFDPQSSTGTQVSANGGFAGTVAQLAQAIGAEVQSWQECRDGADRPDCLGRRQHLVLNLSLGWDGNLFGGLDERTPGELKAPMQAIYAALDDARSRGVLVIAAAGNGTGAGARGPLLPAAWEGRDAAFSGGSPLVFAAGGIQSGEEPLACSRPKSMPPRAAFADHAAVSDTRGRHLPAMTGTSVAAAVVSSVAAVVWHYHPDLSREQLMDLLTREAPRLPYRADFYSVRPGQAIAAAPRAKRVLLCTALEATCGEGCASALAREDCDLGGDSDFAARLRHVLAPFRAAQPIDAATFAGLGPLPIPPCTSAGTLVYQSAAPAHPCPADEAPSVADEPWVHPQPETDPCPACTLSPGRPPGGTMTAATLAPTSWSLYLKISDDWAGAGVSLATGSLSSCLNSAVLTFESGSTRVSYAITGPAEQLCPGVSLEVANIQLPSEISPDSASLSFLDANGLPVQGSVLVSPQQ